jgi:hypothetical protein
MGEGMGVDMVICCIQSLCQSLVLNNFYSCARNRSHVHCLSLSLKHTSKCLSERLLRKSSSLSFLFLRSPGLKY